MTKNKRLTERISSRIRCEFLEKRKTETTTLDVGKHGVFAIDPTERTLNSLIRLRLYLPPAQDAIEIFGRVAWKGTREGDAGIGIHFLKLDSNDRKRWVEYITQIELLEASASFRPEGLGQPAKSSHPGPEKRGHARSQASFMVRFRSKERLEHFVANNLSEGGMFLRTPVLRTVGEKVQVVLIHPDGENDFEIEAEVAHINEVETPELPKGMGLKFLSLTEEKQRAIQAFIKNKP